MHYEKFARRFFDFVDFCFTETLDFAEIAFGSCLDGLSTCQYEGV